MVEITPPNLSDYYGFLVITPQDPKECIEELCKSTDVTTVGIITTCNTCGVQWTTPATITGWPIFWLTNSGEPPVNIQPTVENIEKFIAAYGKNARFWKFLTNYNDIPKNREFRGALKCDEDGFGYHLEAAKFVALNNFRVNRIFLLEDLDKQQLIALGSGNTTETANIEAKKQLLRDKPTELIEAFKTVTTVDEIAALVKS